jgi:hypothetical protein
MDCPRTLPRNDDAKIAVVCVLKRLTWTDEVLDVRFVRFVLQLLQLKHTVFKNTNSYPNKMNEFKPDSDKENLEMDPAARSANRA